MKRTRKSDSTLCQMVSKKCFVETRPDRVERNPNQVDTDQNESNRPQYIKCGRIDECWSTFKPQLMFSNSLINYKNWYKLYTSINPIELCNCVLLNALLIFSLNNFSFSSIHDELEWRSNNLFYWNVSRAHPY